MRDQLIHRCTIRLLHIELAALISALAPEPEAGSHAPGSRQVQARTSQAPATALALPRAVVPAVCRPPVVARRPPTGEGRR